MFPFLAVALFSLSVLLLNVHRAFPKFLFPPDLNWNRNAMSSDLSSR